MKLSVKISKHSELLTTILLTIGIIAAVNLLAYYFFWRVDLTANRLYSISPATKEVVKNLPDVATVKVFFSPNLPTQFAGVRQGVADILAEYQKYSPNLRVEFIDPQDGQEAEKWGVPRMQFNDWRQDKFEAVAGYAGLVLIYRDKNEVIPLVQNTNILEYELTSRLKKLTSEPVRVAFVGGHRSPNLYSDLSQLKSELSKLYQVQEINLSSPIPEKIKTLIVVGPKENFSETELKKLDEFLLAGGSLIALVDGMDTLGGSRLTATVNGINFFDFLAKYGVKVKHNLILDPLCGVASFNQGPLVINLNYPFWPRLIKNNFSQTNPLVANLDGVVLPWVSSLEVDQTIIPEAQVEYLAGTSNASWLSEGEVSLQPGEEPAAPEKRQSYHVAVALAGKFKSAYSEKTIESGRLLVVGDGDFVRDNFWSGNPVNLVFLQNLVDGASLDVNLVEIRAKKVDERPLKQLPENSKQLWRYLNIFGVTVLVLAVGLLRYLLRKRTKEIKF